jgi:hypothetical protein
LLVRTIAFTDRLTDTIITSFPQRYGRNPGDPSSVSRQIRARLQDIEKGEINNAYDIALLVVDECSKTMFEPKRDVHDPKPEFMRIFQNSIARLVSSFAQCYFQHINSIQGKKQQNVADILFWLTKSASQADRRGMYPEYESKKKLLDVISELQVSQELEAISSDLQIMNEVQRDQSSVVRDFAQVVERAEAIKRHRETGSQISAMKGPNLSYDCDSSDSHKGPSRVRSSDELEQIKILATAVYKSLLDRENSITGLQESLSHIQTSVSFCIGRHK